MNVPNLTHSAPLFHQCGVMPIQNRVKFPTVTTVYESLNGLTPDYMKNMFEKTLKYINKVHMLKHHQQPLYPKA